jgi:H+/Cl- antiporter ClcA
MTEATVRTVLRLIAVVTILVGAILVAVTVVAMAGATRVMPHTGGSFGGGLRGAAYEMTFYTALAYAMVAGAGLLLYKLSPALAKKIVAE